MKEVELEPAQAVAAHTLDRHISVNAGPGSGKTRVLVERYLHILREKRLPSIDQIVAITFTNRAANEMRERLRKALDALVARSDGEEHDRWRRYKRTLDGAVITTIHGFCLRLLRDFPVEAELDPQFMLLDEHRAATVLAAAVEESLNAAISEHDDSIVRLTAGIGRSMLANALFEIYLKVRGHGLSFDHILERTVENHSVAEDYYALCDELDALMLDLLSVRAITSRGSEKKAALQIQWPRVREILRNLETPLAEYCNAIAEFRETARPDARGHIATLVKQLDDLFWGDTKEKCFGRLPQVRFDLLAKDYAVALVNLLKTIDQRFTQKKHELGALDFDDLQLRAFELLKRPEVLARASQRYRYFLVDEFQDTNGLQRDLLDVLALSRIARANLFIVGDQKQSVYGFRGADVDVFARMTDALQAAGGNVIPLPLNFRSQPPLINFFNYLFARFFQPSEKVNAADLSELGYVAHENSVGKRESLDAPPLVELMIDRLAGEEDPRASQSPRERDAQQLVQKIISLTGTTNTQYRHIALLFRAMTDVPVYEAEFRRAGIPFQTVLGKGFYEREEITDLIQLCRFLDNRTDEIALAAVLRSPLCGISDNTLLAMRLAPDTGETPPGQPPQQRKHRRPLFRALLNQKEIDLISDDERAALERAKKFLLLLIERRNRYSIADLLRLAIEKSAFTTVIAATFDGGQRLANVEKLINLAERFERSGAHLIRDFVKFVHDFEIIGSRESEGQLDDSANAVKLMTIHQAKGLEFPVVIIPDLHRSKAVWEGYFLLDRHRGLTLKVPDGRGQMAAGRTFALFHDRARFRDSFESMRLLYVAATRARDQLILSGATKEIARLVKGDDNWLQLVWQALELGARSKSGLIELDKDTQLQLTVNSTQEEIETLPSTVDISLGERSAIEAQEIERHRSIDLSQPLSQSFPLLLSIEPEHKTVIHRFSVTQLINYQRCPRQYYFDRVLHVPSGDELAVWMMAEAPEPPANLTATLKGAVIHRFCESYVAGDDAKQRLATSLDDVIRIRQGWLADRLLDINREEALKELWPLAQNYLSSRLFQRIQKVRRESVVSRAPDNQGGLWSELSFRLRRPLGILTGTIDKLLITPSAEREGFEIEVVDFKTNRFILPPSTTRQAEAGTRVRRKPAHYQATAQMPFDFNAPLTESETEPKPQPSIDTQVRQLASDYQLQMQAYALAVRELMGELAITNVKATLHFLQPEIEFQLNDDLLTHEACVEALDDAMLRIISSREPSEFPVRPAVHCRMCDFLSICSAGRQWLASQS
jgi:ATP-dependent helicase/nuclease subunit A